MHSSFRWINCNFTLCRRLKPGGGGVNAAIYKAAGPLLESATKEKADCIRPGKAVAILLPPSSPLLTGEGVTHVIHVLGPNMNPQRPDCLKNDYVQGCKLLREAYTSLFEAFVSIIRSEGDSSPHDSETLQKITPSSNDHKLKRDAVHEPENNKKYKGSHEDLNPGVASSLDGKNIQDKAKVSSETSKKWGPWAQALYNIAMHPDKHKTDVLEILDDVVVMNDAYPKVPLFSLLHTRQKEGNMVI